ncbi:NUDIX hydrolase [Eremococcus coleocola]|uniref:NUDIX hydrolase n=1 Tax=Eremococcus coleocola TaxID=88132 RepID=UPI000422FAE5|nr:NUDIX hydrolase [Eremococcus coleocola]
MENNIKDMPFKNSERLIESKEIYNGAIISVHQAQMTWDHHQTVQRDIIHHQPAVAILAENSDHQVILVKQYRAAVDAYLFELPAGVIDYVDGQLEASYVAAKRELEEETAFHTESLRQVMSFYVSPGYLDEMIYLFEAQGVRKVLDPLPKDEDEFIELAFFDREAIASLLDDGQIIDAKTIIGLQYWLNKQEN